jgi:hypothetical protein
VCAPGCWGDTSNTTCGHGTCIRGGYDGIPARVPGTSANDAALGYQSCVCSKDWMSASIYPLPDSESSDWPNIIDVHRGLQDGDSIVCGVRNYEGCTIIWTPEVIVTVTVTALIFALCCCISCYRVAKGEEESCAEAMTGCCGGDSESSFWNKVRQ